MSIFSYIFAPNMKRFYLFNPENDMALASGSPYYMAPASAKKMASDLAALPAWYADEGGDVLLAEVRQMEWMQQECRFSLPVSWALKLEAACGRVSPWGWNPALLRRLHESGMEGLSSDFSMDAIRTLSGRKTAVELLPKLRMEGTVGESFWLTSVDEVGNLLAIYNKVLLKSPWSGSGKGIQQLADLPDDNLRGWTRRIIADRKSVV